MKTYILLISMLLSVLVGNAQVTTTTVFTNTEYPSFVSDDGNDTYTFSGMGDATNGYLAVYDNGNLINLDFPPENIASQQNADVNFAITKNSITFAYGTVSRNTTNTWQALRKYENGNIITEKVVRDILVIIYQSESNIYLEIFIYSKSNPENSGWVFSQGGGWYLAKLNEADLSLDWIHFLGNDWEPKVNDDVTGQTFRYPIQSLPNGNLGVTLEKWVNAQLEKVELHEFDPNTGTDLGVIISGDTAYKWHRWKPAFIGGEWVLVEHFHENLNNSNDSNGHMKMWTADSGFDPVNDNWSGANWSVKTFTDWGDYDLFGDKMADWVANDGGIHGLEVFLTPTLAHRKNEWYNAVRVTQPGENHLDHWYNENGEMMYLVYDTNNHVSILRKVTNGENNTTDKIVIKSGDGNTFLGIQDSVVVNQNLVYRPDEATVIVPSLPSTGSNPGDWWNYPASYGTGTETVAVSQRPIDNGKLFVRSYAYAGDVVLVMRTYVEDTSTTGIPISTGPTANAQPEVTAVLGADGTVSVDPASVDNGSTGNGLTYSLDPNIFDCGDVGNPNLYATFTVTDSNNNSDSVQVHIIVVDNMPPTAIGQDIQVDLAGNASVSITPADVNNGSTDNCGIDTMSLSQDSFTATGNYSVDFTVTDASNNSDTTTVNIEVVDSVGINEDNITGLRIYPNPVKNILFINAGEEILQTELYDLSGKKILSAKTKMNIAKLPRGTYMLKIYGKNGSVVRKVVKL